MTQRSGSGFCGRVELRKELARVFVEGSKTTFAAKTDETVTVKSVDGFAHAPQFIS